MIGQMSLFPNEGERFLEDYITRRLERYRTWAKEEPDLRRKIREHEFESYYGGNGCGFWYDISWDKVTFRKDAMAEPYTFTADQYIDAVEEMLEQTEAVT